MIKNFLRKVGEWLQPSEKEGVYQYIKTNSNGKLYVDDLEGYLEAGNCFEEMERTAEVLRKDGC